MKAVIQWVLKTMMKDQTGVMRTLPKKDLVDFNVAITAERLMKNGIDPNALKNANQVENAINSIENPPKININTGRDQSGIRNTESAKIFDLEGKEIPKGARIMGGKQAETEAEIAARMSKENKEAAQKIRDRKRLEDRALEDFVDDAGGVNPDDPRGIDDFIPDPEDMAQGGRAGFKLGSINKARRAFLKTIGAAGAGIGALKTGLLGLSKEAAPAVEAVKETVTQAPSYFFDLVAKIKMLGKPGISIGPRQNTMNYKNYELMEDVSTGDLRITKQKGDPDFNYEEEVMEYRKGQRTEDGVIPDEYEEATIRPDGDGKMKDFEDGIEPNSIKEIIEEASKEAPSIKKAGGGIARMLGE